MVVCQSPSGALPSTAVSLAVMRRRLREYVREFLFSPLEPRPNLRLVLEGELPPDAEAAYGARRSPNKRDRTLATVLDSSHWRIHLNYLARQHAPITIPHAVVEAAFSTRLGAADQAALLGIARRVDEDRVMRKYRLGSHRGVMFRYSDALDRFLAILLRSADSERIIYVVRQH